MGEIVVYCRNSKNLMNVLSCGLVQHCFVFLASFDLSGLFFLLADISIKLNFANQIVGKVYYVLYLYTLLKSSET